MSLRFEEAELMERKDALETRVKDLKAKEKDSGLTQREEAELEKKEKEYTEVSELLKKKIISVTMSNSLVNRIDELVKDRVGRSRAQLIEDSVRWYLDFTVHKWNERGIFFNSIRMVLESEALNSLFFSKLTPADQRELGLTAGNQAPISDIVSLFYGQNAQDRDSYELVFQILQDNGWGEFRLQGDLVVIGSPFYPAPFIQGYLESLLGAKIETVETKDKENVAFRIKR